MDAQQDDYRNCKIIAHYSLNCEDYAGPCYTANWCTIIYPDNTSECISINNGLSGIYEVHKHIDNKFDNAN
jgi:hypothetical protein